MANYERRSASGRNARSTGPDVTSRGVGPPSVIRQLAELCTRDPEFDEPTAKLGSVALGGHRNRTCRPGGSRSNFGPFGCEDRL